MHRLVRLGQQSLAVILSALLLLQPAIANAQSVSASTTAPAANQPGVGAAPNGVPLIDIVTPNAAGLSHNKFSDFNVGTPGLILNNYKGEVGTSNLGGVTPGNPNLNNSNPASVILNEVTGGNRSALNGPTEVFGGRADVVIANPNGITCSGCGFINTPHATLTTGVPDIGADGSLTGFTVNGGDVTFEGTGGNFASGPGAVDLFDVVSRNIHVNAPVYGKTLRLTGGASKYDYATGEATALTATSGTPEYAIDGTALGAMQADRIKIVVTEKGAGVNMAGDMAANAGELSLSADGKISIGNVSGSQGVSINSKSKVTAAKVASKQKVTVQADQGITLQSVAADEDIVLASGSGLLSVAADINSATAVQMSSAAGIAAGSVTAGSGTVTLSTSSGDIRITGAANSHGALTITATSGQISAASLLSYDNISLTAGLDIAVSGNVFAEGNLTASGRSISTGMVVAGLDIAATQADPNGNTILAHGGDLQLTASGAINATNLLSSGNTSLDATTLTAQNLTAHGTIDINATTSLSGQILGGSDVTIVGQGVQAATFASGVDFAATSAAGGTIVLAPTGALTLDAGAGTIVAGTLLSAGDLHAQAAVVQADSITSHGTIGIDGGVHVSNQLLGAGNITINGNSSGVSAGVLASGVDFAATNAGGGNIVLAQSGDLTINDSAGAIQAGTMLSAGTINASGQTIAADTISGHSDITLSGATDVSGQILGAGNVSISGSSITAAAIVSGVDIAATNAAGGSVVLGTATTGTADLSLAATAGLDVGTLLSAGALSATGATITADSVTAHGDLALDGATTVSGQVLGSGNVLIAGQSVSAQTLVAGIDFNATNAAGGNIVLSPGGDLTVSVSGAASASTIQAAGSIDASGATISADAITGHKDITLSSASGGVDVSGQILGANDISISGASINAGAIVSGVDFARTAAANGNIVQTPSGDVSLTSTGNIIIGTLLSAGDLTAQAAGFKADDITSNGDVDLKASLDVGGHVLSAGSLSVDGASLNAGLLASGVDLAATDAAGGNIVLGSSGFMNLTAAGNIAAGTMLSGGDVTAKAANLAADSITSHGKVDVIGNVDVTNQIIAAGNLTLSGGSISAPVLISGVDFAATNAAGGNIVLGSSATMAGNRAGDMSLTAAAGIATQTMLSAGTIEATAATITANAVTAHGDITLAGSSSVNVTGQLLGANDISLSGQTVQVAQAITGVDFAATAQSPNDAIVVGPTGDLDINAASATTGTLIVAGNLDVVASAFTSGNITSHGAVGIGSAARPGAVKINGQLLGANDVSITGSDISGNVVVAGVDFAATNQSATGDVILGQAGNLTLSATAGDISANSLLAAGTITANATNNVNANAVAQGDLTIGAGNAITLTGQSLGAGNVNLAARSITIDTLVSGVDFSATKASSTGNLMLQRSGTTTLSASSGSINANSLLSGGNLAATATQNIGYNSLQSLGNAALTAPGAIAYTSTTRVGGSLTLNTGALDLSGSRGSRIASGGTLVVNASSANLAGSNLVFGGLALNLSGSADLSNAQVSTVTNAGGSGDITVSAASLAMTSATSLLAAHDLTLDLPSLGNTGQFAAGNNISFNVAGDFNNTPSGLVFAGNTANLFLGGTLTNNQGAILSANGLVIAGPGGGQRNGAVVNIAGLLQSGGNMSILTNALINTTTSGPAIQRNVQLSNTILSDYDLITRTYGCETRCSTGSGQHEPTYGWTQTIDQLVSQIVSEDQLISGAGPSAKIRAGGALTINATNLTNAYSSIKSDSDMVLTVAGTLTNDGATLNRTTQTVCDSDTPCQYFPDVVSSDTTQGGPDCSGPNRPCIGSNDPTLTYSDNPNGQRDPSKDLAAGTTVTVQAIGALSGVIQARGALSINGGGSVNNVASNGSIAGQVAIDAPASASNPLGALSSMTAGGALFNVNAALTGVASNGGATAGSGPTIGGGPAINGNSLTANGGASANPNSLIGKLTIAIGNSGNLAQTLAVNGAQLAAVAKPQSGGVGGTVPGQVFLFETRAAFLDVSKFYGSGYFIDRIGYTPETKVPFLGDAYFDNQLVDEQLRQLVGDGLGAGSFIPGNNAIDQMKTLLDNGVTYAAAHGFALGQALTSEQAASLTQSMVIYQTETIDGAQVLVPVVYLSAADRANIATSAATISGGSVSMDVGSLNNSGAITAADGMTINASDIKANGGAFLAGGNMNLNASNGITLAAQTMNIGGQTVVAANGGVTAGGSLKVDAGAGSLTLAGTKVTSGGSAQLSGQTVTIGAVRQDNGGTQALIGTKVTTGGNLNISGTDGVNIIASSANVGGDLSLLSSNGAVNIVSAGVENTVLSKDRLSLAQGGTTTTTTNLTQQGSSLIAGGAMLVSGDQGVLIGGSSLDAGGNIGILSQNGNVAIAASQDQTTSQSKTIAGAANGYKSGQSSSSSVTSNGSSITSENGGVTVQANNGSIGVIGSDVDANGGNANLIAKGDVTIGEATDTASSSSSSGKKKTSEATSTAQGSSISGQTGVNIGSTGNVTISASDVTAGDASHTADANINAAGNIVIASGKDTKETTSDSKSSGFLSSSKTHTHSYDEDTVGSSISASGNISANAGGETVVSGSDMAAGGNLSLSGSTVTIMGAEEEHESDKQTKKSGIGVGSGGGFISIYGSKDSKSSSSQTDNIGSTLTSGGTTTITSAQGDVNIFGSSSHSGDGTVISSARDVNIAPGAEEQSSSSQTKRSGFGINLSSGDGSLSIGIGVAKSEEQRSKDANINAVSTLDSDGSITIAANRNINDQSGKILAAGPIGLIAGDNVNLLSSNDVTNASEMQKKSFAGVSLTVQSSLIGAGQQAMQAGSLLSGDNGIYGIAPAVLAGVKGYQAMTSTMAAIDAKPNPDTGLKPAVAGVSLTAGYSFSESSQQSTTSIPVPPEISGSSVTIIAQSGDVVGSGVQISAGMGKDGKAPALSSDPDNGSVLISAAGNVDLESVQATSDSKSSSKSGSVSIGVAASIDASGNVFNAGPTANAAYGSGKQAANSVTQVNSNVSGTNTVTVVAGDKLTLAGGVLAGKTVNATAGNGIVIESRQDTASYDEKSKSAQLGISSGGISGGYNQGTITGDYANVSQQSGIFAGSGGYHVNTDGTIDLIGGFIGSTAAFASNDLNANQILYSNIENSMSASSTSYGFSLIGAGIPVPVVGQPAKQSDSGATLATITPGNWNLTGQSQDLSGLNTDASKANNQVDPFDIDKLKAQQQSAAALSALLNMGVGELSERLGFAEGSPEKVALHAAVGAIVAQVAGGNVGAGALSGALSEIANGVLQQVLQADPNLTDTQKSAITQWVAAAVGAAVGGGTGAAAALDNVNYNYLTHEESKELEQAELACRGGSDKDCTRQYELLDLSQARDDQLHGCVGNSSSECVKARTDLRIAAAEYVDAALTGGGDYISPIGGLQRHWALLQAYDYADDSDLGQIADADRIAASFKSDEAKALLTASKSEYSSVLRYEILYGVTTLGANGTSGKGSRGPLGDKADADISNPSVLTAAERAEGGTIINVNPADLRWTQTTAGGNGRADVLRQSIAQNGYSGPPIDVVQTADGIVTVDHTRAAIALEQGITSIPATVHLSSDPLPATMVGRFGSAMTWGDAAAYRAANQRPPLPPTGTTTPPKLPTSKNGG